jgi:hypothetical protein
VLYSVTGIPCPSCGMTRAILFVFAGDFTAAIKYHPLFLAVPIIPVCFIFKRVTDQKRNVLFSLFIALFVLVWVVRLGLYFPHTEPFVLNDEALIPKIISFLKHE